MKIRNLIVIIFIIPLLVLFSKMKEQPVERTSLFPKEEFIHMNIERIEILEILSNDSIVIDDKARVKNISSFLMKLNSDNIDIPMRTIKALNLFIIFILTILIVMRILQLL